MTAAIIAALAVFAGPEERHITAAEERAAEAIDRGNDLLAAGRWEEGLAAYDRALRNIPENAHIRVLLAAQLLQNERTDLRRYAYRLLREATKIEPDHYAANAILGDWYLRREFFRESADRYRRALRGNPGDPMALHNLAISLAGLKRFEEAIDVARRSVEASKGEGRYRVGVAWIYVDWRREEDALEALKGVDPAALAPPDRVQLLRVRAQARFESGDEEGAIADLKDLTRSDPRYARGFQMLGLYCQRLGRFEDAEAAFRQALAIDPDYEAALYGLGQVCMRLRKVEEGKRALAAYKKLADARQRKRLRDLREMTEELQDRQRRGWIPGMGGG
ncbi:MAG: tetratricopeptide repeat protein [Planctomycetes bacterium]|nr:tetratricopeptide repeat protein [Planctomycetota bacterium]